MMTIGETYKQRALAAVSSAFDGATGEYEAIVHDQRGMIARQQRIIEDLKAQLALPDAVTELRMQSVLPLAYGIQSLGEQLGRPLAAGERARLYVPPSAYAALMLGAEEVSWWSRGTLEVVSSGQSAIVPLANGTEAINIQSAVKTGGTCHLVLRNFSLRGHVHISCPDGIWLSFLGTSTVSAAPRPADPPTPL